MTRCALLCVVLAACHARAPTPVSAEHPPEDPHHLGPLARRIVTRVAALGARIPSLAGASAELRPVSSLDTATIPWEPRFYARWNHQHAVSWEPDPTYVPSPHTARSPYRDRLDPSAGLILDVYLYEGSWSLLFAVNPVALGRLRVVTIISTPNPALRAELERAIGEILDGERAGLPPE